MLKELLVSDVRIKILRTFIMNPGKQYHIRGLVREVGTEINAVRRELLNLEKIGFVAGRKSGNRIYYMMDDRCLVYPELSALVVKEFGLGYGVIKNSRQIGEIKYAVLSRTYVKGRKHTPLDVDLLIVGKVNVDVVEDLVRKEQELREREINYTVMGEEEFNFRKRKNDQFIIKILSQGRIMLLGNEEDFCSPVL